LGGRRETTEAMDFDGMYTLEPLMEVKERGNAEATFSSKVGIFLDNFRDVR
jgi:hypothetical protein